MKRQNTTNTPINEMRRVRYTGDHPWIKNKVGVTCFDSKAEIDLFRPDVDGEGYSEWYRVSYSSLEWLD